MPSAESRWDVEVKEDQDLLLYPLYASAGLTFSCRIVTGARCKYFLLKVVGFKAPSFSREYPRRGKLVWSVELLASYL